MPPGIEGFPELAKLLSQGYQRGEPDDSDPFHRLKYYDISDLPDGLRIELMQEVERLSLWATGPKK